MRTFTAESMLALKDSAAELSDLAQAMQELQVVDGGLNPRRVGVLISLERDFAALLDAGAPLSAARRLFFRLLDARILSAYVRAIVRVYSPRNAAVGDLNNGVNRVHFSAISESSPQLAALLSQIGATNGGRITGGEISIWAEGVERELRAVLNDLAPVDWATAGRGHTELISLRVLSSVVPTYDDLDVKAEPLIMLDDGHLLGSDQRAQILAELARRDLRVGLWFAERYDAMAPEEVMAAAGEHGRDHRLVDLSSGEWGRKARGYSAYERMLEDVSVRRAGSALEKYADTSLSFPELLDPDENEIDELAGPTVEAVRAQLAEIAATDVRFESWAHSVLSMVGAYKPLEAAVTIRASIIIIERQRQKEQADLFDDLAFPPETLFAALDSQVREAAHLFLAEEFGLPYYYGSSVLARLGSQNVSQYLNICSDHFDRMMSEATLGRQIPWLSPTRQDRINVAASERLWREIPSRISGGRDVQNLLSGAAKMARAQTYRNRAPYAPGVTGFAIKMEDQLLLASPEQRRTIDEKDRVAAALGAAIANNLLVADPDRPRAGGRIMRLYLNRLLCPRFNLPLGRGGWRTRKIQDLSSWVSTDSRESEIAMVPSRGEQLTI